MNIVVFDTETTDLEKPFCYDVGYVIYNTDMDLVLVKRNYLVKEIWNNIPLFSTSYFTDKRPMYEAKVKRGELKVKKWKKICEIMQRDFQQYKVENGFAYNSSFDVGVFDFNTEFFKTVNPLENAKIFDIMGYVHKKIAFTFMYQNFCDKHKFYTQSGHYSTTAETVTKYLTENADFVEEHTALADALIELDILKFCINEGCEWAKEYKRYHSVPRKVRKTLTLTDMENQEHKFDYEKIIISKDKQKIILKKF